jgi:phage baseplate assembly protein V
MKHSTSRDSANRHGNSLTRTTYEDSDDTKLIQEVHVRLFHSEQQDTIEHMHPYGFSTKPKKPTGSGALRQAAESILAFLGGNRSHGIAMMVADRRYRPNNLTEGEVVLHEDQGNQVYLSRNVLVINGVKEIHIQVGDSHFQLTTTKAKMQNGTSSVTVKNNKTFLGKEDVMNAVVTANGQSSNVFSSLLDKDIPLAAAATAKQTAPSK